MGQFLMKIKIFADDIELEGEIDNSKIGKEIYKRLPFDGASNRWGDEIYFAVPIRVDEDKTASEVVEEGDLAYWHQGHSFCIFFGKTPASEENLIKAASKVSVFGKVKGDYKILKKVRHGDLIIVEQA